MTVKDLIVRKDGVDPYPEVTLYGEIFLSIIQSMNYYDFQSAVDEWLTESEIRVIDPDAWYPRQEWLNLLIKLEGQPSSMQNQVSIGMKVIDNAVLPEDLKIENVQDAISVLIAVYTQNQQNLPEGDTGYEVKKIDEKTYEIWDTNPYLLFVNYGYIYGILKRFLPTSFTLKYEYMNKEDPQMGGVIFTVICD